MVRFYITRSSIRSYDRKGRRPCEEAYKNDKGEWIVDFQTLDELVAFAEKHQEIVLSSESIEIYDDYRE